MKFSYNTQFVYDLQIFSLLYSCSSVYFVKLKHPQSAQSKKYFIIQSVKRFCSNYSSLLKVAENLVLRLLNIMLS